MKYCLVGALTAKSYSFMSRPWEVEQILSVDFFDSLLSPIVIEFFGMHVVSVLPFSCALVKGLPRWVSDKVRFSFDLFYNNSLVVPLISELVTYKIMLNFLDSRIYKVVSWKTAFMFFYCYLNFSFGYISRSVLYMNGSLAGRCVDYDERFVSSLSVMYGLVGDMEDFLGTLSLKCFLTNLGCVFYAAQRLLNMSSDFFTNFLFFDGPLDCLYMMTLVDYLVLVGVDLSMELPLLYVFVVKSIMGGFLLLNMWFLNRFLCSSSFYSNYKRDPFNMCSLGQSFVSFLNFLLGRTFESKLLFSAEFPLVLFGDSLYTKVDFQVVSCFVRSLDKFMFSFLGDSSCSVFYFCSTLLSVLSSFFLGFSSRISDLMKNFDSVFLGAVVLITVNCNNMVMFKSVLTVFGFMLVVNMASHFSEYFMFLKDIDLFLPVTHCYERVACGFSLFGDWKFVGKFVYSVRKPVGATIADGVFMFLNFLTIDVCVRSLFNLLSNHMGLLGGQVNVTSLSLDCFVFFALPCFLEMVHIVTFMSGIVTSGLFFKSKDDLMFSSSCYYLV